MVLDLGVVSKSKIESLRVFYTELAELAMQIARDNTVLGSVRLEAMRFALDVVQEMARIP